MSKKQAVIDASAGKISMEDLQSALTLSPAVERRVNALMNLHDKYIEVNKKHQEEIRALEKKYAEQYKPLFEKRESIANGKYEPTDEEAKYGDEEEEEEPKKDVKKEKKGEEEKGIPGFWFTAMQNNSTLSNFIFENDEEALEHLTDIRTTSFEKDGEFGFELTFHFSENAYFTNTVLTKKYFLGLDDMFGEYTLERSEGCEIDWKAGQNLVVKTVKKKIAAKGKGAKKGGKAAARVETVQEPQESFFNFFKPPQPKEEEDEEDEDEEGENDDVMMDFDIGNCLRDSIIPFAVLWYTGEASQFDGDDFGEYPFGGEDDEDDEEEDEEEEEEEEQPKRGGKGGKGGKGQGHQFQPPKTGSNIPQPQQPECKQQ